MEMKPFIKWVGGKSRCVDRLVKHVPTSFNTYYEAFLGSGALLFRLQPQKAVINDLNPELINTYRTIKDDTQYKYLIPMLRNYQSLNSADTYRQIRALDRKADFLETEPFIRAARFIYLNKTGFNGLYRVNKDGYFNVPYGKDMSAIIYTKKNLDNIHKYLSGNDIQIINVNYTYAVIDASKNDFVYFDPPYDSEDGKMFNDYTKFGFCREEQERLANLFDSLTAKGVLCMMSNANTEFIRTRYAKYRIESLQVRHSVGSTGTRRHMVDELLIMNY